ncbi:uncharacterized protein V2V93DRAFT_369326 [Kockiozyma suomiensis]|uniref:uncharacterized protein n=1 Tax=Kockiozyma suomiensis TaxID=1337062 RepID=UPI003342FBDB
MASSLQTYVNQTIIVMTSDGRLFSGILQGYDQQTNLILNDTKERVITPDMPTEILELGLYLIRGDSVVLCGLVDIAMDSDIDWDKVRGQKLHTTKRPVR